MNARGLVALIFTVGLSTQIPALSVAAVLPIPLIQSVTNAPNPFDSRRGGLEGQTQLSFVLVADSTVQVTVYDLFGFKVREWGFRPGEEGGRAGQNNVVWDGTNAMGQHVSKGGYIARIVVTTAAGTSTTRRKIGVIH
jgi:hypothetical protein